MGFGELGTWKWLTAVELATWDNGESMLASNGLVSRSQFGQRPVASSGGRGAANKLWSPSLRARARPPSIPHPASASSRAAGVAMGLGAASAGNEAAQEKITEGRVSKPDEPIQILPSASPDTRRLPPFTTPRAPFRRPTRLPPSAYSITTCLRHHHEPLWPPPRPSPQSRRVLSVRFLPSPRARTCTTIRSRTRRGAR